MAFLDEVSKQVPVPTGGYKGMAGVGQIADLLNPAKARLNISGLFSGGAKNANDIKPEPTVEFRNEGSIGADGDWRVRISLSPESNIFYTDAANQMLAPLTNTNGVVFPYTPNISVSHNANYTTTQLTHSNYDLHSYQNSSVSDITISGEFTVQSEEEGNYLLAALYFFRSATKMFFGSGNNVGNPPPIVFLDGYGTHYFPHVPCVISSFTHRLPNDVDYIPVTKTVYVDRPISENADDPGGGRKDLYQPGVNAPNFGSKKATMTGGYESSKTRVPVLSAIDVTLKPIYSRKNLHDNFDLNRFSNGELLGNKTRGGFL